MTDTSAAPTSGSTASSESTPPSSDFYDYDGNACTLERWSELTEAKDGENPTEWLLGKDLVLLPDVEIYVSTVWVGLRMWPSKLGEPDPYIYETMIFARTIEDQQPHPMSNWMQRHRSRDEAINAHITVRDNLNRGIWPAEWPEAAPDAEDEDD